MKPLAVGLLLVGALTVGCNVDEFHEPKVSNATGSPVELFIMTNGVTTTLGTIQSHVMTQLTVFNGTCTDGTLIARSLSGEEVARRTDRLCPDEVWTIGP